MGALTEEAGDVPAGAAAKTRSSQRKWPKFSQGTRSHTLQLNILHGQIYAYTHAHTHTLPSGASGKESPCQSRRHKWLGFYLWVGKIPWERAW